MSIQREADSRMMDDRLQKKKDNKIRKKRKAIYASIANETGRSCKTIKCNREMNIRLEFTAAREGGLNQLSMSLKNNNDGTATLVIRGSRHIKLVDNRE